MPEHAQLPAGATGRCRRDRDCVDAVRGVDPDDPSRVIRVGAPSDGPLCPTCVRYLRYTMAALPIDVAELSVAARPTMENRYKNPDMPSPPRVKLHSPMPLDGSALALQSLIDHEVTSWAESVADSAGLPWDSDLEARQRPEYRVRNGCQLLAYRTAWLLALGPQRHRVYSAGEDPTDGWPEELQQRMEPDDHGTLWIERDGVEGALALFDLHAQVESFVGRAGSDRIAVPCPRPSCGRRAVVREHRYCRVTCRYCRESWTDDEWDRTVVTLADALAGAA